MVGLMTREDSLLEKTKPDGSWSKRASERIDDLVGIISPRKAFQRKMYRFGYDAIDKSRLRKKRKDLGGTGDSHLTEDALYKLREICREMSRNNPLANGLLKLERNGVIGSGVTVQGRTDDDKLNDELEAAWKEEMLDKPCDVTGRFNFNQFLRKFFLAYRRDGDAAAIFLNDKLQAVEGDQIGTPIRIQDFQLFQITNGIAYNKITSEVIGYYIGIPDKYGYIKTGSYKHYPADKVHLMFDPARFSQSRGEPVLTPSINFIDTLCDYIDAEFVAAKVNACFSMFIAQEYSDMPQPYTKGISSTGYDAEGNRLEKMSPGQVIYGAPGETATGIGQARPNAQFDPFVLRMLTFIARPLCMPLMLVTMDFSGATFMNARLAYQKVQEEWQAQQDDVIKPFVSRVWRWKIQQLIDSKQIKTNNEKILHHEVLCRRWPYVDPFRESEAHEQEFFNGTNTRTEVCASQGRDFKDVTDELDREENYRATKNVPKKPEKQPIKIGD
jgi:lambda family phage portal protein